VLPAAQTQHDVLATLWARTRINHLMSQDWAGIQNGNPVPELREQITRLGLDFRLMTQFTSFVAVEEKRVVEGGTPRVVQVPVEMPSGVSYEGVFGEREERVAKMNFRAGALHSVAAPQSLSTSPVPAPMIRTRPMAQAVEPARDDASSSKLSPELAALARGSSLPPYAAHSLNNGKVKVRVWLLDQSAAAIETLKKAGLELTGKVTNKMVTGAIEQTKLNDLAKLAAVQFITLDLGRPQ
jgi:Ca-activated chloride channel family protein